MRSMENEHRKISPDVNECSQKVSQMFFMIHTNTNLYNLSMHRNIFNSEHNPHSFYTLLNLRSLCEWVF